jgi:hypothetical protein
MNLNVIAATQIAEAKCLVTIGSDLSYGKNMTAIFRRTFPAASSL